MDSRLSDLADGADALMTTSVLMLTVGFLACVERARRALRIHPTEALKERAAHQDRGLGLLT